VQYGFDHSRAINVNCFVCVTDANFLLVCDIHCDDDFGGDTDGSRVFREEEYGVSGRKVVGSTILCKVGSILCSSTFFVTNLINSCLFVVPNVPLVIVFH
jgi:hypothetical protein